MSIHPPHNKRCSAVHNTIGGRFCHFVMHVPVDAPAVCCPRRFLLFPIQINLTPRRHPTPLHPQNPRYRMRRGAHWRAIDPLDLRPDEWLTDPNRYKTWSCSLGTVPLPPTEGTAHMAAAAAFRRRVGELESVEGCERLGPSVSAEGWASGGGGGGAPAGAAAAAAGG